jgi:PDZ domain-containing protein
VSLENRRRAWLGAGAAAAGALLGVGLLLPVPYLEMAPGPTFNTLGDIDGTPVISIKDQQTYPTSGHLDLTTVNERGGPGGGLYAGRVLIAWADPNSRVVPREVFYPDDVSADDAKAENAQMFSDSESDAVAAALRYLKLPVIEAVVVSSVIDGGPSDGKLTPGDQLLTVNGTKITTSDDVTKAMSTVKPGDVVTITVRKDAGDHAAGDKAGGKLDTVEITTGQNPEKPGKAFLGIGVGTTYRATFPLTITVGGVGGPSAGTMLALGIIDKLTPGDMNGGKFVAGTGTIDPDGNVGPIGGIAQKMVGARRNGAVLFLAPASNCADVAQAAIPDGLTVAKIATLSDAVKAVEDYAAGKPVTGCS